jgi:lipopolysaccharide export system protein LptC
MTLTFAARTRYWLMLLPFVALLIATYWLNMQTQTREPSEKQDFRRNIDATIENFLATQLDAQGQPHFSVSAKLTHHYPDNDSTILEQPALTLFSGEQGTIRATAGQGKMTGKGDEILLQDHVRMQRDIPMQTASLTLNTELLHILPEQSLITTDRPVTLTAHAITVNAVGLEMNYKERVVKLLSRVRGIYAPVP